MVNTVANTNNHSIICFSNLYPTFNETAYERL
jgi:hypothetical protein